MKTKKVCKKGIGKALGFEGCGNELNVAEFGKSNFRYGLGFSCGCFATWLRSSEEGNKILNGSIVKGRENLVKIKKKEFKEKKKDLNTKNAMDLADKYFSRYVRLKHSKDGNCTCYTCGTVKDIKDVDNGHFMKRGHQATRYHLNNCRPQDKTCNGNTAKNGMQIEFRANLVNEVGEKEVQKIEALSQTTFHTNSKYFRDIADYYRVKVNDMQKELGVKYW
ncbi:NinG/ Rap DNA junction specific endonuclease [Polaribacter phage P12002L]|uniref:Protein ninG n=2 Tax=Incheonvirus TaxID=2976977 RepID=A0A0F7IJQ5_9CAUD|nr:NinG/ Rap DNA junction specific endonuclease [Polaribacter phage P12002S]YP_009209711.1 NinG/ Rap DNA junction specific endonuclease [Polaribacter phage P12002L]AKG94225.1 NinG recombination protein [Polaribacter phage P12002L]AKG94305.1 NinG recombination protein [Polaribacter phage P12002S]